MTALNLRYFVARVTPGGDPRHYWQPSSALRRAGWHARTLSRDKATAWGEADAANAELDAWYATREATPGAGTVKALIAAYKASRLWAALAPKSRRDYAKHQAVILQWFAATPARGLTPGQVQRRYESLAISAPSRAAAIVGHLRVLYRFAINNDLAAHNPATDPQAGYSRAVTPLIWPAEVVAAMIEAADACGRPSVGDAIAIGHWLGHYPGDLVALTRANYVDGVFRFDRAKTGAPIAVPHDPLSAAHVAAALARQKARGVVLPALLVCEATGSAYSSAEALAKAFRKVRAHAAAHGDPHLQLGAYRFKWLRHTAVVRLAEAGCTTLEIAAITGHGLASVNRILAWYFTPTETIASNAAAKRLDFERDKT